MSELVRQVDRYLAELERRNMSAHTLRNYRSDLDQFIEAYLRQKTEKEHKKPPAQDDNAK